MDYYKIHLSYNINYRVINMKKIYAEIGFGNKTFLSTEIENKDKEYRINRFIRPKQIKGIYIRIWILKRVLILSTCNGISLNRKNKNRIKFIFGIQGN